MKKKFFLSLTIICLIFLNNPVHSLKNKIVANVGNEIISSYELKNKIMVTLFLNKQELTQDNINNIKETAIRFLIDEKIKRSEILKYKIPIESNENTRNYLSQISSKYNTDIEGLKKIFDQNKLDFDIYVSEIRTQFAWNQLIYNLYKGKVELNNKEIDEELNESLSKQKDLIEYNLSQIELTVLENKDENIKQIENIKSEIKEIGFKNTAIKYSISSTSTNGGNLGWISAKSISKNILNVLKNMKINEISEPLIRTDTILFLKLEDKKVSKIDKNNTNNLRKKIISNKQNELLNLFSSNHLSKVKNNTLIQIK